MLRDHIKKFWKGKARGRGRPRAKIELAPLGGKWDGAEFYAFNTHQGFWLGKDRQETEFKFAGSVPL